MWGCYAFSLLPMSEEPADAFMYFTHVLSFKEILFTLRYSNIKPLKELLNITLQVYMTRHVAAIFSMIEKINISRNILCKVNDQK